MNTEAAVNGDGGDVGAQRSFEGPSVGGPAAKLARRRWWSIDKESDPFRGDGSEPPLTGIRLWPDGTALDESFD